MVMMMMVVVMVMVILSLSRGNGSYQNDAGKQRKQCMTKLHSGVTPLLARGSGRRSDLPPA